MMVHPQIDNEEIVERYVRNQLTTDERTAFEEHFFGCEACFDKLQTTERFVAGIRDASTRGLLKDEAATGASIWLKWAFATTGFAALILAALTAWTVFIQAPKLREELNKTASALENERQLRSQLEQKAAQAEQTQFAEANIPLVMLQTSRSADDTSTVLVQPGARRVVLWIETTPQRYREFRLEILSPDGSVLTSVDHLQRGPYGALAAAIPAEKLPTGEIQIRLSGQDPPPAALVGEYRLRIRRP
jgi:putative zinc finger protein